MDGVFAETTLCFNVFGRLVGIAHSAQTVTERWSSWMAALGGQARVMIGPRSVIFAPIHDAGLIVVDEEHDASYKNEEGIRYHARDLAVALAGYSKCPIVLGSATPSSESFANARRGRYRLIRLLRRINDRAMASVEIVDMRREVAEARKSAETDRVATKAKTVNGAAGASALNTPEAVPLSSALVAALRENLESGGQSMVFLNRRGFHNFLQCHICGNVIACPNCSVSMTFHLRDRSLRCHYCGNHDSAPDKCPECDGYGLQGQGFGTERLTQTLATMIFDGVLDRFPELRIGVIEQGAIWVPSWMRQMESAFDAFVKHEERLRALSMRPSDFVRRQVRFTPYPTEDVGWIIEQAGDDVCMFSSDFPHVEGGRKPLERFEASLGDASDDVREKFYRTNFEDLMGTALDRVPVPA